MADIRADKSEVLHYDDPDYQVFYRKNNIPGGITFPDMTSHWHDEIEILYVMKGCTSYRLNDKVVKMNAGEGIFVNSRQLHVIIPDKDDCELCCLIFHPMILSASKAVASSYINPIIENDSIPYIMLSEKVEWQRSILKMIQSMKEWEPWHDFFPKEELKPGFQLRSMQTIYAIWEQLVANVKLDEEYKSHQNKELYTVKKMINYIQDEYKNKITLEDICKEGNIGKTKCTQLFSTYMNCTPMEYVKNYRLDQSFILMQETDLSITEIAYETGFSDASYYAKAVKQIVKKSPLEMRRELKVIEKEIKERFE